MLLVLSWMVALQSRAPWLESYWETAVAISVAAEARPVFKGDARATGAERTAALLVAIAFHESRFDPHAVGDHGQSRGLYQLSRYWRAPEDVAGQTARALDLIEESQRVCRGRPVEESIGWFASGGSTCGRPQSSRIRFALAKRLLEEMGAGGEEDGS